MNDEEFGPAADYLEERGLFPHTTAWLRAMDGGDGIGHAEAAKRIRGIYPPAKGGKRQYDPESAHSDADALLCDILRRLGYTEAVAIFENSTRWYA